jgi:hypothetical protein
MTYSTQTQRLSSLCRIQSGYTARARLEPASEGGVPAIQLRDLSDEDEFDPAGLPAYPLGSSFERYWAKPGDVLFRSRGERNTAVTIASDSDRAAVAILPLLVLHPKRELIDPKYVTWFINQPDTQRYFDKCARGTRLRMIPKQCLDDLEVPVPDLPTQRLIVEIDALARRERALTLQLADKKLELTRFALLRQVRSVQPHGHEAGQSVARRTRNPAGMSERTTR